MGLDSLEGTYQLVAILPEQDHCNATATQNDNGDGRDNQGGVISPWLFGCGCDGRCFHVFLQTMTYWLATMRRLYQVVPWLKFDPGSAMELY